MITMSMVVTMDGLRYETRLGSCIDQLQANNIIVLYPQCAADLLKNVSIVLSCVTVSKCKPCWSILFSLKAASIGGDTLAAITLSKPPVRWELRWYMFRCFQTYTSSLIVLEYGGLFLQFQHDKVLRWLTLMTSTNWCSSRLNCYLWAHYGQ